jgi:hypothetical protein
VPIPSYVSVGGSADSPLIISQPFSETAWEFWEAARNPDGSYSACWGGELDMASWTGEQEYQVVANLPWSSLQAVDPPR